jgi:hypothetical protein
MTIKLCETYLETVWKELALSPSRSLSSCGSIAVLYSIPKNPIADRTPASGYMCSRERVTTVDKAEEMLTWVDLDIGKLMEGVILTLTDSKLGVRSKLMQKVQLKMT